MKKYWAFLSYSSADSEQANWLQKSLEHFPIPAPIRGSKLNDGTTVGRHLRPIFRDRTELPAAGQLNDSLRNALDDSRYLIVLCSPHSANSHWVNHEVDYFIEKHGIDRVLAVIVDGKRNTNETDANGVPLECFPKSLRHPAHPLAADLRPQGDGRKNSLLKVLAGALEVGFDDLARRHRVAEQRRRVLWASAAVVFLAAGSVAGWRIMDAERRVEDASRVIEVREREAERAQREAEDASQRAEEAEVERAQQVKIAGDLANKWFPGDQDVPLVAKLILSGTLAEVQAALSADEINTMVLGDEGMTPFMLAAASGNEDVARWMIEQGAEVDRRNAAGETALTWAAFYGQTDMIDLYVEHGLSLDTPNGDGQRPIDMAVMLRNYRFVEKLVESGVSIERDDWEEIGALMPSPIFLAADNRAALKLLLDLGADPNVVMAGLSFRSIVRLSENEMAAALLADSPTPVAPAVATESLSRDIRTRVMMGERVDEDFLAEVEAWIEQGGDVNHRPVPTAGVTFTGIGAILLQFNESESKDAMIRLADILVRAGADVTLSPEAGATMPPMMAPLPQFVATTDETTDAVRLLQVLSPGVKDRQQGNAALGVAAVAGKFAFAEALVEAGLGTDLVFDNGNSFLGALIQELPQKPQLRGMVDTLIANGADVKQTNRTGDAIIHIAAAFGDGDLVDDLVAAGADPDARHPKGANALVVGIRFGNPQTVRALLRHGGEISYEIGQGAARQEIDAFKVAVASRQIDCLRELYEFKREEYAETVASFAAHAEEDPDSPWSWRILGSLYFEIGNWMRPELLNEEALLIEHMSGAERSFRRLLELESGKSDVDNEMITEVKKALRECEQLLAPHR